MRMTSAAICTLLIAGCGGGSSDPPAAMGAVSGDAVEVKTFALPENRLTREALDNLVYLYNKIPAPSSSKPLSATDIKLVRAAFDGINDAVLRDR